MGDDFLLIGAGPLGLAVAKALSEGSIPYDQVEATDHVGGNWAHGVYTTAHIISSRKTTEYPDWPMPADYPDFPSAAQMRAYFEAFTDAHDLRRSIRFGVEVTAIRYLPAAQPGDERWEATFADGSVRVYRGVIVCNGHHWSRELPDWANGYEGPLLHSKDYQHPDELRGKRVLVVGGGNSGCDIISEAARVASAAHWSLRRGYWFLPKTLMGKPSVELMFPWMPVPAQRLFLKAMLRVAIGRYEDYGLPRPDHRLFEAHPSVSTEALHYLKHGRITVRPDVREARGQELLFTDGRTDTYDLVVCATGFKVDLPFLPSGMVPIIGKTAQLYAGLVRPEHRHLYVVGTSQTRYGIGPLVRPLARLVARFIALQDQIEPTLGELLRSVGQRPPKDHLVDPHKAMRQMWLSEHVYEPLLLRRGRKMGRKLHGARSAA